MVQVDVFWAYALGAGFAAAASRQIKKQDEEGKFKLLENKFFSITVLYLGVLFAPSGLILLWAFTGWETMYWVKTWSDLPAWLVGLFAITNVTQGILGFWVASIFIRRGNYYAAHLQWVLGYFLMFFILVHGWDGFGYRRFFTIDVPMWQTLHPQLLAGTAGCAVWQALRWATTAPVAWTLYAMGVIMMPPLFFFLGDWAKQGLELADIPAERVNAITVGRMIKITLKIIFVEVLAAAIVCSLLIHWLCWWGLLIFIILAALLLVRRGGLFDKEINKITLESEVRG